MKSISIFFLPLIILIAFPTSSLSSFLSDFQGPKSSLLNAYASKSGNITMTLYSPGWLVYVDVSDHESEATDDNQDYSYGMKLALYTSQSFYADYGSCIDFYGFDCTNCVSNLSAPFSADYVQFSATGYMVQGYMYLDYTYWEIDDNQIGYATDCSSYTTLPYGNGGYGMIGLGMANGAQNNFLSSRVFSISLNSTTYNGNLVFESEYATFPSYTQVATLTTDNNWTISTIASIGVGLTERAVSTTVIFDINSDMIGLPTSVYNFLLKNFQKNTSTICSTASSGPSCPYQGYIHDLPNITLTVQNQDIPIPPQIYLKYYSSYNSGNSLVTLTLNFKELNSSLVNESYVTPAYENYIILDSNFMAYYMTVFNGSDSNNNVFTVGLYTQPHYILPGPNPVPPTPGPNPDNHTWIYIVVGVVCFIIFIGAVICVVRRIRKRREALLSEQTFLQGYSPEEPSVFEQNMPSYQYNQYNQYNVPPPQQMGYDQVYYTNQQQQQQSYPQVYQNNQQQQNQYYVKNE